MLNLMARARNSSFGEVYLWSAKLIRMLDKIYYDLISPLLLADPIQIFRELITKSMQSI